MGNWVKYLIDNPVIFGAILFLVVVGAVASIITLFKSGGGSSAQGDSQGRRAAKKKVYFQIAVSKDPKYKGIPENLKNFLQSCAIPAIKVHAELGDGRLMKGDIACLEVVTGDTPPPRADVLLVVKIQHKENDVFLQIIPLNKRTGKEVDVSVPTEIKVPGTSITALGQDRVMNSIITILTDAVKGKAVATLGSKGKAVTTLGSKGKAVTTLGSKRQSR